MKYDKYSLDLGHDMAPNKDASEGAIKKILDTPQAKNIIPESVQLIDIKVSNSSKPSLKGIYLEQAIERGKVKATVALGKEFREDRRSNCHIQYQLNLDNRIPAGERFKIMQELTNKMEKLLDHKMSKSEGEVLGTAPSQVVINAKASKGLESTFQSVLDELYPQS